MNVFLCFNASLITVYYHSLPLDLGYTVGLQMNVCYKKKIVEIKRRKGRGGEERKAGGLFGDSHLFR